MGRAGQGRLTTIQRRVTISPEIAADIEARYLAGQSLSWLSESTGIFDRLIRRTLVARGVAIRGKHAAWHAVTFTDRRGRNFLLRSLWEAKTAAWLDAHEIRWDYEHQAFDIGDGRTYTPDFWLYDTTGVLQAVVDVKGWLSPKSAAAISTFKARHPHVPFELWGEDQLKAKGILDLTPPVVEITPGPVFRLSVERRLEIERLYASGLSTAAVGKHMGRSSTVIKRYLNLVGKIRPSGGYRPRPVGAVRRTAPARTRTARARAAQEGARRMGIAGQGRLNFVIPEAIEQRLDVYCDRTGRTPTDVIRQLVSEALEGDRELPKAAAEHPAGRRTNIPLSYAALARLDEFVREGKHASAAAVIATLLGQFLANRVDMKADEVVIVHVPLPVSIYSALSAQCARGGMAIEKFLVREAASAANVARAKPKAKRS